MNHGQSHYITRRDHAISSSLRVHAIGVSLTWAGYIVALVLRTLETTGAQ